MSLKKKQQIPDNLEPIYFEVLGDLYNGVDKTKAGRIYGFHRRTIGDWQEDFLQPTLDALKSQPRLAEICFGQQASSTHFDTHFNEETKDWEITQRVEKKSFDPDIRRAVREAEKLLRHVRTISFPASSLPDYLVPVCKDPDFNFVDGVHYVAAMVDEIPVPMKKLDPVTCDIELNLQFEVERVERNEDTEALQFELLNKLLTTVHEQVVRDGSVRVTRVHREYKLSKMNDADYQKFREKKLDAQLKQLQELDSERIQRDAYLWNQLTLSDEVVERLNDYMDAYKDYLAEQETGDDTQPRDVSSCVYIVMYTDWDTWFYDEKGSGSRRRWKKVKDALQETERVVVNAKGFFYVPRGKVKKSWNLEEREQLLRGGRNTGKTLSNAYRNHIAACKYPGTRILVVRQVYDRIIDSYLPTYESKIAGLDRARGVSQNKMVKREGTSPPAGYTYWNGSTIAYAGMSDREGLLSQEWDLIHSVETTQLTLSDWVHMLSSLGRGVAKNTPYHFMLGDCNPPEAGRYHWIYRRQELCNFDTDYFDNPELYDTRKKQETETGKPYLDSLRSLPPEERARFYEGKVFLSADRVYSHFSPSRHVITKKEFAKRLRKGLKAERVFLGQDSGYRPNPGVLLLCMLGSDKAFYVVRGTARVETPYEIWERLALIYARWSRLFLGKYIEKLYCEHDPQMQDRFKKWGLPVEAADKRNKMNGIRDIQGMFYEKDKIFIVQEHYDWECPKFAEQNVPYTLIEEAENYAFSKKHKETGNPPEPKDGDDHWLDTMLYIVRSARLGREAQVYTELTTFTAAHVEGRMMAAQQKRWEQYQVDGLMPGSPLDREPPKEDLRGIKIKRIPPKT